MKPSEMLHQMCYALLADADIKVLLAARGFPQKAASSRGVLETLFLSPQGLGEVFETLDAKEIAAMHLLKSIAAPVDVSFFARVYGCKPARFHTFNQRFKDCFAKVKQRLVRKGVILWAEVAQQGEERTSQMERWRFALPPEFHGRLPPLIESPRHFDGNGDWRPNVVRDKLMADLAADGSAGETAFGITAGELRLHGKRFSKAECGLWLEMAWKKAILNRFKSDANDRHSRQPHQAVLEILSELPAGHWVSAELLSGPLEVFCGQKVEADAICQAGWETGLLAQRREDGKSWYRRASEQPSAAPDEFLTAAETSGKVIVHLQTVPVDALEQLVAISDQAAGPGGILLLAPNLVKLGRADDELLAVEPVRWLLEKMPAFTEVQAKLSERRGKTILHEDLCIAKVGDLSLKVAMEKSFGNHLVSLKNDYVAFPRGLWDDVRRLVQKSGHVVKEVAAK